MQLHQRVLISYRGGIGGLSVTDSVGHCGCKAVTVRGSVFSVIREVVVGWVESVWTSVCLSVCLSVWFSIWTDECSEGFGCVGNPLLSLTACPAVSAKKTEVLKHFLSCRRVIHAGSDVSHRNQAYLTNNKEETAVKFSWKNPFLTARYIYQSIHRHIFSHFWFVFRISMLLTRVLTVCRLLCDNDCVCNNKTQDKGCPPATCSIWWDRE